jgi:hypothetical protein
MNIAELFRKGDEEDKKKDLSGIPVWKAIFKVNKESGQSRIRFLHEFDDDKYALGMHWHKNNKDKAYGEYGINMPCWADENIDGGSYECPYCAETDKATKNNAFTFMWLVWDYEERMVRVFMGRRNPKTLAGKLWADYDLNGTILGRDYTVKLAGMDYSLSCERNDSPFLFEGKVKLPTRQQIVNSVILAVDREKEMVEELGLKSEDSFVPANKPEGKDVEFVAGTPGKKVPGKKKTPGASKQEEVVETPVVAAKKAPKSRNSVVAAVTKEESEDIAFDDE